MGLEIVENFLEIFFFLYLCVSIVTTEEPVLSTALVMKDLFGYKLTSLISDLVNCFDIVSKGNIIPIAIDEETNNCLKLKLFKMNFFMFSILIQ